MHRATIGDRLEHAIAERAEPEEEIEREAELEPQRPERNLRRTAFWLVVTGISLYLVAPSLIEVLSSWEDLDRVDWWWFAGMVILQTLGLACLWYV